MLGEALQAEQFGANGRLQLAVNAIQLAAQGSRRLRHQTPEFGARHSLKHLQQDCQQ
jgi:hypothetical protein